MKKFKIVVSLAAVLAIAATGYAFAKDEAVNQEGKKPSFKMTQRMTKKPEMTEEMKSEMMEKSKEMLLKSLEEGKITEEQYNEMLSKIESGEFHNRGFMGKGHKMGKREKPEMTEEMKSEMMEKSKEMLSKSLEEGKITEEQYNEMLLKIESGEFHNRGFMGKGHKMGKREKPEMTEEMKSEMMEKSKEMLSKSLEEGKITEEQYNEMLSKIESGEFQGCGFAGKENMNHGMRKAPKGNFKNPEGKMQKKGRNQ